MLAIAYDNETGEGELVYANGALVAEGFDLETAILLSLFLDAPAQDVPRDKDAPRGGWWGDRHTGDKRPMGSRLWLLEDALATPETAQRAKQYAEEAVVGLVEDKHVRAIDVTSAIEGEEQGNPYVSVSLFVTLPDGSSRHLGPFRVTGRRS